MRIQIQEDKQLRIQADPDPGQTFKSQKVEFYMKNLLKVGDRSKNIPYRTYQGTKAFLKGRICKFWVNFHASVSGSAFPIRIWIQDSQMNAD
jgi:hypothetical protein